MPASHNCNLMMVFKVGFTASRKIVEVKTATG